MQREREVLEVHGESKTHEFISGKLLYLTKEVRVPYIEEESQEDRTGPLSLK